MGTQPAWLPRSWIGMTELIYILTVNVHRDYHLTLKTKDTEEGYHKGNTRECFNVCG